MKQIFMSELTDVTTYAKDVVGDERFENGQYYVYVQNVDSSTLAAGTICCYDIVVQGIAYKGKVTEPITANLSFLAGIAEVAIPTTDFGWILVDGVYDITIASSSVVSGDVLNPATGSAIPVVASAVLDGMIGSIVQCPITADIGTQTNVACKVSCRGV